jgi:hypothetical protein
MGIRCVHADRPLQGGAGGKEPGAILYSEVRETLGRPSAGYPDFDVRAGHFARGIEPIKKPAGRKLFAIRYTYA